VSQDVFVIDDLRVYKPGPYTEGDWDLRGVAGGNGIGFVYELFSETHHIFELFIIQGFVLLFPRDVDIELYRNLVKAELS
jgi:hypothetical protein